MEKSILRNIAVNFAGLIVPTAISLVTVPLYIRLLGVERYGVINLVWALIGYFSLLDLGTSMATENQIAKVRDAKDDSVERIFWGAFFLNLSTGIVGALIVYFGAYFYVSYVVHIEPVYRHEILASLPWIAIAVPVANVTWVFAGAITAVERFGSFNTNQTLGTMLFQVLPLVAVYFFSPSLTVVIPAAVLARIVAGIMLGVATLRALGIKRMRKPAWSVMVELFSYGRWLLLFSGAGMIASSLDRVLVGALLGARFVTYYATPQNLVTRLNMLPSAMLRTLFPRLSSSSREHADDLARSALAFLNGVFTPCVIVAMVALGPFMHWWLGDQIATAAVPVGRILIIGVWLTGQSSILGILIQAQANPAQVAKISWVELPVVALALWLAIHQFGVIGAGWVMVAKALFDYAAFLYFAKLRVGLIARNMAVHLTFLLVTVVLASSAMPFAALVVAGLALLTANVGWSIHASSELRTLTQKIWSRLVLQSN